MAAHPVDLELIERPGPQRAAHPPPARPRRSRRGRSTASTTRARCWSGPAPGRPPHGSRSALSPGVPRDRVFASTSCCTSRVGEIERPLMTLPGPGIWSRSSDPGARLDRDDRAMIAEVDAAQNDGDTLGGIFEVIAYGLPVGLGSYVQSDRRLDGRLAGPHGHPGDEGRRDRRRLPHRAAARQRRPRRDDPRRPGQAASNRAGGIEGGMTNGEDVRVRAAMKPISTLPRSLRTVDFAPVRPHRPSTSDPTSARSRRPGWWPRRWWRSCWPTPRSRSSAATRSAETRRNLAPTCRPRPSGSILRAARRPSRRAVRAAGPGGEPPRRSPAGPRLALRLRRAPPREGAVGR